MMNTKEQILRHTTSILAREGYVGTSMRDVAEAAGIKPSVIYNHFADKEDLLRATRMYITRSLDESLRRSVKTDDVRLRLRQTLAFQLENRENIVALLQYFMAARDDFSETPLGYVPERAYQHMREIIDQGIDNCVYTSCDVQFDAKSITHMVNGFLMEYFDRHMEPAEIRSLSDKIAGVIERSLLMPHKKEKAHYADAVR